MNIKGCSRLEHRKIIVVLSLWDAFKYDHLKVLWKDLFCDQY